MDGLQVRGRERNTKSQTPSSREIPESKHQKPSSKHQRNPKFQAPNRGPRFELGTWSLELLWCLEFGTWTFFGVWCLELQTGPLAIDGGSPFTFYVSRFTPHFR